MDPLKVAARFIAFTCCLNGDTPCSPEEAGQYARSNWRQFLPFASDGLGEFLTHSRPSPRRRMSLGSAPANKRSRRTLAV